MAQSLFNIHFLLYIPAFVENGTNLLIQIKRGRTGQTNGNIIGKHAISNAIGLTDLNRQIGCRINKDQQG